MLDRITHPKSLLTQNQLIRNVLAERLLNQLQLSLLDRLNVLLHDELMSAARIIKDCTKRYHQIGKDERTSSMESFTI